ncbi:MAG: hypothetical protein AAF307_05390 [Pseudomonadota bacterium]
MPIALLILALLTGVCAAAFVLTAGGTLLLAFSAYTLAGTVAMMLGVIPVLRAPEALSHRP